MRKRTVYTLLAVLAVFCALAAAVYLRGKAPPEVARLLPESDAILYVNLKPLRTATHFDRNPISPNSFAPFIAATGILPERDVDSLAVALYRLADPNGPNGPTAFSLIFQCRFDRTRLARYLASISTAQESYANRTIYAVPSEGRTVRVALLGYDMVATSNAPTPEQIHSILDRQRAAASPFAGSALLEARFADVPAFSTAWAIGRIGLPFASGGRLSVLGLELPLPADSTFVASLRYTNRLALRIDQLAPSEAEAAGSARSLNSLLSLLRSIQRAQQPTPRTAADAAFRDLLNSIVIAEDRDRVILTGVLPVDGLRDLSRTAPLATPALSSP